MAAPFKPRVKVVLEKGCQFSIGVRIGNVVELRREGYLVFWSEWTDPETGVVHAPTQSVVSYSEIVNEDRYGNLKVLTRPMVQAADPARVRRSERLSKEIDRQRFRKFHVLAVQSMLDDGSLQPIRDDFCRKIILINARAKTRMDQSHAAQSRKSAKRGGARMQRSQFEIMRNAEHHHGFQNGQTIWKWYWQWKKLGDEGLFDSYRKCGKYKRHDDDTEAFILRALSLLWDEERPTIKSIVESVQAMLDAENERRERLPVPAPKLKKVGYDYIVGRLKDHAPLDHKIRKHGWDKAYKDMHSLGVGVETSRALERVEIDEYTVDLFVLMSCTGLFDDLPASIKESMQLDGKARRVKLSAAIDVHTRCIVALQIVLDGAEDSLRRTVEMIYSDKSPIADAAGAEFDWPMSGAVETLVPDRGSPYVTDDSYEFLASLGITNLGAPAGKPWLKPFIERVFRTVHQDLLLRFSGRSFGNVVARGENNPALRATLDLEDFLAWLVRWTVDAYHSKRHSALGMSPAEAWRRAVMECAPRSLSNAEMREAFGTRLKRKLQRGGLRVEQIDYQADAIMEKFHAQNVSDFEVLRWNGDIGTISVRCDDGPWIPVPARDQRWIGKTDTDLRVWLAERKHEGKGECLARRDFLNDVNAESIRRKALRRLLHIRKTPDELEREQGRFMRHADTAERRHASGPYRELLADLDDGVGFEIDPTQPGRNDPVVSDDFDEDSME